MFYMINVYRWVLDSIRDLSVRKKIKASRSINPALDSMVLSYLAFDRMFFLRARDNQMYWYCFVNETYLDVAEYIMRANGLNVSRHISTSEYPRPVVLRVLQDTIRKDEEKNAFVKQTMSMKRDAIQYDRVFNYMQEIYADIAAMTK